MKDKITKEKIDQYRDMTARALEIAKKSILKGKEKESYEIVSMVSNYLSDSEYLESQGDLISAFAALNYAHGWLDAGVRLDIFDVKDDSLFTIK